MHETIAGGGATSSRELIATATQQLGEEAKSQMQSVSTLSRSIRNWRQSVLAIPAIPRSRVGYEIPETFKHLTDGSLFLAFDSGIDDPDRILIFATESGLDDLVVHTSWACDGTFKSSPSLWMQLCTIHVVIKNLSLPRVFALLPNKQETTYRSLFEAIFNLRPNIQPTDCLMDFEKAMNNAFVSIFPNAHLSGCLFHFGQSCWRKICDIEKKKNAVQQRSIIFPQNKVF